MGNGKLKPVTEEEWSQVNKVNQQIAKEFLRQSQLSPNTLKQYQSAVQIFFRWVMQELDNKPLNELKPRHGLSYQNFLVEEGLSPNAVKFKRSVVSSLCGFVEVFMDDEFPTFRNIFNKKVPNVAKTNVREKIPITSEEYKKLCDELEKREEWQMLAFLKFTYFSGCRKSEVHQLLKEVVTYDKVKDRDGNYKPYYQTHNVRAKGKGREGRLTKLIFDDEVKQALEKWLSVRGDDCCEFMFVTKKKNGEVKHIDKSTFNYWASNTFSEILGREIWVHLIRSSRATNIVVEEGKSIEAAQVLLGHSSSETTKIYVVRDHDDDLDELF